MIACSSFSSVNFIDKFLPPGLCMLVDRLCTAKQLVDHILAYVIVKQPRFSWVIDKISTPR